MYQTTQIIVKPKKHKELCGYFSGICETYNFLKNTANFHIRQHITEPKKPESESIQKVKEYIPVMINLKPGNAVFAA